MSTTTNLKISKKMAELLAAINPDGGTVQKVAAEVAAGRADKAGAVMVEVEHDNAMALLGFALGSIGRLDAALETADPENKHRLMGEHSAWRALLKQLPPIPSSEPQP